MYMKLRVCSPSPQISISSRARQLRLGDLAADRRGRLLAAAVVGAVRPVDVVVARDARLDAEVVEEVPAHALREELLPAVPVLGQRRVRVLLAERGHVGVLLERDVVDARRRREEEPLDAGVLAAAISRCVLISTEIMQAALFASMNPMPPMSHARL